LQLVEAELLEVVELLPKILELASEELAALEINDNTL